MGDGNICYISSAHREREREREKADVQDKSSPEVSFCMRFICKCCSYRRATQPLRVKQPRRYMLQLQQRQSEIDFSWQQGIYSSIIREVRRYLLTCSSNSDTYDKPKYLVHHMCIVQKGGGRGLTRLRSEAIAPANCRLYLPHNPGTVYQNMIPVRVYHTSSHVPGTW